MTEAEPEQWAVSPQAREQAAQVAEERGTAEEPAQPPVETRGAEEEGDG